MALPEGARSFGDAIRSGDLDLITDVLDSVDLDAGDAESNSETPLMLLCHSELEDDDAAAILELMLLREPDVNRRDADGRTALCHACMAGLAYFIRRLAQVGRCDPNLPDHYGNTALMFAVYYGELTAVRLLLEAFYASGRRVDVGRRNDEGIDAITIAEQNGFDEIVELLTEYTANVTEGRDVIIGRSENGNRKSGAGRAESPTATPAAAGSHVGSKASDFRRRKFKPLAVTAQTLGPLVVQNRLQSSKSAEYCRPAADCDHVTTERQCSYSAGDADQYHVICDVSEKLRRQTEQFDEQYMAEDERSESTTTTSGRSDDQSPRDDSPEDGLQGDDVIAPDEGYAENPTSTTMNGGDVGRRQIQHRKPSISLPDLRKKPPLPPPPAPPSFGTYSDSGYDTRSGRTTRMREELSLPEIPEPDSSSNEDDYTPRTRRDSLSLPDLRGLRRCLVGSPSGARRSPRLTAKQLAGAGGAALVDLRKNELVGGSSTARDRQEDDADDDDDDDDRLETIALKTPRKTDDSAHLTLPKVRDSNVALPDAKGLPATNKYKAWGTPRPNNTPRAPPTMTELNKKMASRHKMLTDRA